jgi:hypothetical protein
MESLKGKTALGRKAEKLAAMAYAALSAEIVILLAKENGVQTIQMCGQAEEMRGVPTLLRKLAHELESYPQTVGFEFPPEEIKTKMPKTRKPRETAAKDKTA